MKKSLEELDPNFQLPIVEDGLAWHRLSTPFMEGLGWPEESDSFCRMPHRAENVVRDAVWELSRHSAGIVARFFTDALQISARWTLRNEGLALDHMPASGVSGIDLYARDGENWRWAGVGRAARFPDNETVLAQNIIGGEREYLLYMPLYNGVTNVQIGVPQNANLRLEPRPRKPLCFYGTSIVQGGCASRAGMAYPAILGRRLDFPIINLGFSGNGQAEPEIAALLAELDASVFILDCLPNLDLEQTQKRVHPLIETLRRASGSTPIVLVENITYQFEWMSATAPDSRQKNVALHEIFGQLKGEGMQKIYYLSGADLLGDDGEGTVDGAHPTDAGFMRMADGLEPLLKQILNNE